MQFLHQRKNHKKSNLPPVHWVLRFIHPLLISSWNYFAPSSIAKIWCFDIKLTGDYSFHIQYDVCCTIKTTLVVKELCNNFIIETVEQDKKNVNWVGIDTTCYMLFLRYSPETHANLTISSHKHHTFMCTTWTKTFSFSYHRPNMTYPTLDSNLLTHGNKFSERESL